MKTRASLPGLLAGLLLVVGAPVGAKSPASVQERVAQQNALFDEYYETELRMHPEMASPFGDYGYNDRLNDYSLAGADGQNQRDQAYLACLKSIPVAGFSEQD